MIPQRIQRKRTRGWKMPPNTVFVGRPTKWGNPIKLGPSHSRLAILRIYRNSIVSKLWADRSSLDELRGKNLACWCSPDEPCHADILLEMANRA